MTAVTIDIKDAREQLETLVERVCAGEEFVLIENDAPVAKLVPFPQGERIAGLNASGGIWMSETFDDPLPDDFWFGEA